MADSCSAKHSKLSANLLFTSDPVIDSLTVTTKMSFFERLRNGVQHIETEVKKLKELTENGDQLTEEQMMDNLMKAKRFESDVRQTYVSSVSSPLKTCPQM